MPKHPCKTGHCRNLVGPGEVYCETCLAKTNPVKQYRRKGASARGYDNEWRKLSRAKKAANPICERCNQAVVTIVHHIVPIDRDPSKRLDWDNLLSVCDSCHQKLHKELEEQELKDRLNMR